ncbi:serine-rich adhesin for platelets-like isoform X2 [Siniperca chuatsi]|uniref:serine-rich adhesin for platelets-like isoform X2 n=1 Tax=Siniperca chuatsi TaxID=119488 RepID=UPI001CE1D5B9|nr:serine-rich adhesin for platelets-like isoform X2 [Siniperca chuatsi]
MTPWQVLRASRATRAALGYRVHHGPGGLVLYSTAPVVAAAAVAADSSRSFCLSREKLTLQQLNSRLASYLQQVQSLEAANQRLEHQIQKELDRKCPRELRELDGYLKTASLLQDQISECLSAQAQVKLQLLNAELTAFDLNVRCEKERESRGCVEAELSDLRLLEEELQVHRLPELQSLLNDQTQQLMELQIQHQQDMQGFLAQVSEGVTVEMQPAESSDLIQQLDDLRQTGAMLLNKNQNECCFNTQVSTLSSPEVTCDPPAGSEVVQAELEELRRTAASLEEELTELQALNMVLEASGLEQKESFVQRLVVLQQRADGLCRDLDSVLQAVAQQAGDHQALLDTKSRLETEIQDYRRLLDGLSPQRVSSLHSNSAADVTSFCATTSPSAFRRNVTANKTANVQGGNLRMMEVQTSILTVRQTPDSEVVAPLSPVTSINISYLMDSFHKSENQITEALPERTGGESMTFSTMINKQSSPVEDKACAENHDLQNSSIVSTQISQGLDERAAVKASKPEINTAQGVTTLVPDTQSARSAAVQAKPETFTSKQTTTETGSQTNETGTNIQAEITKTILCAEPEVKQEPHFVRHTTTTDPSKQTATEVKKETETVISAQINCNEGSIQAKNQEPAQVVSLSFVTPAEAVGDAEEVAATLMDDMDIVRQEKKGEKEVVEVEGTSLVLRLDQSSALSNASNSEQNKLMEDADTGSGIASASSGSPDSNDNLESKTANTEILKKVELEVNKGKVVNTFHDTNEVKVDPTESDNEMVNLAGQEALLSTTESKKSTSLTDSGVALSFSGSEELLSPREDHVLVNPTKPVAFLSPKTCLSPVETEVLDQVFFPVDLEEHVQSPDSLDLSPNDPEMFLSTNDSDTCLSPVEANVSLSPNGEEEDEEVSLSLTEANAHVRPVEKYILLTKEEGQSLSFSEDQALPEEDRNRKVSISVRDGDSLCFGSFEGNEGNRGTLNHANISSRLTSQGLEFGGPSGRTIIADKEEQLGFGGLYCKSVRDVSSASDGYKNTSGIEDNKDVQNPGGRTTFSGVASNSGGMAASKSGMASDLVASFGGTAANSSDTAGGNAESAATARVEGRFRRGSGEWMVYGGRLVCRRTSLPSTGSEESTSGTMLTATSRPETGRFGSRGSGEWMFYSGSLGRKSSLDGGTSLPSEGNEEGPSLATNPATSPPETGRFGRGGSGEWMVYGDFLRRKSSLPSEGREESQSVTMLPATSPPETRRFGSGGSEEWMVYSGSLKHTSSLAGSDSLPNTESRESLPTTMHLATSPPGTGRFGSGGSGEWKVYGGSTGRMSSLAGSDSLHNAESPSGTMQLATSPPGALGAGRFSSGGSGEWKVYGGSTGRLSSASSADRVSVSANYGQMISPPSSHTSSGPRLSSGGSGGRLSSRSVVRRSSSVGSGGRLSSSGSGGMVSSSSGSHRTSSTGRFASTGSGEWKPVYSSASARRSSVGSAGRSSGGGTTSSQRTSSPGGRMSVSGGSGGWLSSSTTGGNRISSPGSASKLSSAESSDRVSNRAGGRINSFPGSGRTNSTGGRVISSSDRPIRSTGSGAGGNKERISVCKMAALSISAAGRERSQDRQRQAQRSQQQQQQQQQQAAGSSPLVQRWLTSGAAVTSADPDDLDDIMRL